MAEYLLSVSRTLFSTGLRRRETLLQLYAIGVKSAPIILFSVSFAAAVTILEYSYHMKLVIQSAELVPGFASLLIIRELGAVITALLLTSRVGAGIAAELGLMKITEQIDALRLLRIDPIRYLVVPRVVATVLSSTALCVLANTTCLLFSMIISSVSLHESPSMFLHSMTRFASFADILLSLVKASVFGLVIPLVSCYCGLNCEPGAEGVGRATTEAVVTNAVGIILIDFILTWLFT